MNMIYVAVDEDGEVIKASQDQDLIEGICEDHAYQMRERAAVELGHDGDGYEKDLREAEIYAAQNYPIWSVGYVSMEACQAAEGGDVAVEFDDSDEMEVNAADILSQLTDAEDEDCEDDEFD